MGIAIDREEFSEQDHAQFAERLQQNLVSLRALLAKPGFGEGETSIGAELEMHLIDAAGEPAKVNAAVLAAMNDDRCALEVDAFNFEVNASPVLLAGRPFSTIGGELRTLLQGVRAAAAEQGARVLLAGTLPTLTLAQLQDESLSDASRYRAMSRALRELRGEPFALRIAGREALYGECSDLALEGATASLQVHLRVEPRAFVDVYNAAQLAAGPLLAATGNSPYFEGKDLWEETRIALFKQAVDTRIDESERTVTPARVSFGHAWIHDAFFPFQENVALYTPLIPVVSDAAESLSKLSELRLHHGTVWNWNRAVFDPADSGHLRIEHRVVASGPTVIDMLANAAFTVGLTLGLAPLMAELTPAFPFQYAERNMYRGAKLGLEAELAWPSRTAPSPRPRNARELLLELLPLAEAALVQHGVAKDEASELLGIIAARVSTGQTGAVAQRKLVAHHEPALQRPAALARMIEDYLPLSWGDAPVHTWKL